MAFLCLIRAIMGPRTSDRVVAVNMMGTIIIAITLDLSLYLNEGYLVDIAIIYALLSFLAVVVLTKVYMGVYEEKKEQKEKLKAEKKLKSENVKKVEKRVEKEEKA
ncbi:MAG: sodium:proton antiporter [Lachnospiraceae bacterium]|nr:sodium:proton antiporter [Lachnospiraceae bacterium]